MPAGCRLRSRSSLRSPTLGRAFELDLRPGMPLRLRMKYQKLPDKRYATLCRAMEEEGWISHSIACCLKKPEEKLPVSLEGSRTFADYKAGNPPPRFPRSGSCDTLLVFKDANGKHSVPVRVHYSKGL